MAQKQSGSKTMDDGSVGPWPEMSERGAPKTASQSPSEGEGPVVKPNPDGTEAVAGARRTRGAAANQWTAPDTSGLPDIGELTFGPPPPKARTVHGPDNRVQIANTAAYPWSAYCSLLITAKNNGLYIGTGWFVGPKTVITAGHCLFVRAPEPAAARGWVKSVSVMPGRNGSTLPYGAVTVTTNIRSTQGWVNDGNPKLDYGAILLPTPLGDKVGWFGCANYSDSELQDAAANVSGYPGDKPDGTQWYDARTIAAVEPWNLHYDIDTYGGQSGSAVLRIVGGQRFAVGIHNYGGATTNSATRINASVLANIKSWKA
ncbi:MAG: trypsin-like serine protease [Acidobacteriota bacterium]|nr:trypsin-like serine protease [Acidobacteriota bacterium]